MGNKAWETIDRWGPAAIALIALFTVIAFGWIYSSRLSAIDERCKVQIENLNRRIDGFSSDALMEKEKNARTREKLIRKGWID